MYVNRFGASVFVLALVACLTCSAQESSTKDTLTPSQVEEKEIQMRGSLSGIGATLEKKNDQLVISKLIPGSPAEKAGLKAGQFISAINSISTAQMTMEDAVKLIRGPKGSKVELTVSDSSTSTPQKVAIVRDVVTLTDTVATSRILDRNIGLLTIPCFNEPTPKTVTGLLQSFTKNGVQGLVLDLRGNGGGSYRSVTDVTSLFTGKEPALWLRKNTTAKQVETVHGTGNALWQGPMVVLVDGMTAVGGELIASALQTSDRAKVLGQKTYGHAAIRSMESQPDGSSKVTVVGYFLTAGGDPIDGIGIKPDVLLDANLSKEEALQKALETLSSQKSSQKDANPKAPRGRGSKAK